MLPPIDPSRLEPHYVHRLLGAGASVILEIGANDGLTTADLAQLFPHARVFAFEPDPRAARKFRATVTDPRVELFELAIGAIDGEAEFNVSSGLPPDMPPEARAQYPQGWDRSSSLHKPKAHKKLWPWCKFESKIAVPVKRLDTWVREHSINRIDFIWADVQGAEGDLISGGRHALSTTRYLFTEYSNDEVFEGQPTLQAMLQMLPSFVVERRFEEDVLLRNTAL